MQLSLKTNKKKRDESMKTTRRNFIKKSSIALGSAALLGPLNFGCNGRMQNGEVFGFRRTK